MWMIEFKSEKCFRWITVYSAVNAGKVRDRDKAHTWPSKEEAESYLSRMREHPAQMPRFWDGAEVVPAEPEEERPPVSTCECLDAIDVDSFAKEQWAKLAVQVHAAELVEDDDDDAPRTWHPPEEEPLENFVDRSELRVVRETHQLPRGFLLETEWHPEGTEDYGPYVYLRWLGPAGFPNAEDPQLPISLAEWYEEVPSGKGDDARDLIRSVVAKYTEVLGD